MPSFFKKALGIFVELEEDQSADTSSPSQSAKPLDTISVAPSAPLSFPGSTPDFSTNRGANTSEYQKDAEKFEKHFEQLLAQSNFPGIDYFEFYKMMETLEPHIHDERARLSATFASLSVQGLTKKSLVETANKYKQLLEKDRADFEFALTNKYKAEVEKRQQDLLEIDKKIAANSELIQKLTQEIADSQIQMGNLKAQIVEEENKINKNNSGYRVASQALIDKISADIQKIQSTIAEL